MCIYLPDAIYPHVVIGLTHITEGVLVMHIASIAILTTRRKRRSSLKQEQPPQ